MAKTAEIPKDAVERARRVFVLFGWDEKIAEKPATWPVDTMTGELFQAPLEWLGYEVEYHDLGKVPLPQTLDGRFAAVLIDAELEIPAAREIEVANWLLAQKERGVSLLFTGGFPFSNEDVVETLHEALGIRGTLKAQPQVKEVKAVKVDAGMMNSETPLKPRKTEFRDLQAPEKARVFVSLTGSDEDDNPISYDPVFLADWGGVWLEPFIILRASADNYLFHADPYKLLSAWLGSRGVFPVPDTSTRDGRRIFYSHIDGDGFASQAEFKGHPICAELIRDRVLKTFPLPVTVSVVEADIRGQVDGLKTEDAPKFVAVAKEIYALPHIRTASHSYSHPYIWEPKDANPGIYDELNLPMKAEAKYAVIKTEREVRGSVEFINKELAPKDKPVELFFWPGNCRPGPHAIQLVREMGIENMNGGNTIISRLYPGIAGVAPRVMWWDGELQVNASNQNEFMYANGFNGPFYGGFATVIDTFERTEKPRRLKPVNVYYHFYSATYASSLMALEKIHRWCMEQPLHSMTALEFVKLTKDSLNTRIYDLGPRRWMVANAGAQRTFRMPSYLGKPDLSHCSGITGYKREGDQLYIHTSGQSVSEICMVDQDANTPPTVFLSECSAEIAFDELTPLKVSFSTQDLRPVEAVFGGLPPKGACDITINGKNSRPVADADGHLALSLPRQAKVSLDATRSRYADSR